MKKRFFVLKILVSLCVVSSIFAGCSSKGAGVTVTEQEFGDKWPFTVSEGTVSCEQNALYFEAEGKKYALNGTAKQDGVLDLATGGIWKANPSVPGLKISIDPIQEKARGTCK